MVSQGVVTPTISNIMSRNNNSPFAYTDFNSRPNREFCNALTDGGDSVTHLINEAFNKSLLVHPMVTTHLTSITNFGNKGIARNHKKRERGRFYQAFPGVGIGNRLDFFSTIPGGG
jgi:hypothetical protein